MSKKIRIFSLLFCAVVTAAIAWKMTSLALWGWWTFGLLSGMWLCWLLLALPLYTRQPQGWRWLGLSTLSGVLLAAGFPISPLTPLLFVAWVPLLCLEKELAASDAVYKKRLLMRYAYNTFVIWNILATWWVANAGLLPGMIANYLNAFFMCLPFLLYHICKKYLSGKVGYLALPSFWFSWEYLHLNWDLSWPWLTLGNAFSQYPNWVQWYEYTGVFGGTLWIFTLNFLIFRLIEKNNYTFTINFLVQQKKQLIIILLSCFSPLCFSYFLLEKNKNLTQVEENKKAQVVVLQPNYEPHYQKFEVPDNEQLERFLALSKKNVTKETDYLLLPETSFGYFDIDHLANYPPVEGLQALADSFPTLHIVAGFDLFSIYADAKNLPPSVRKRGSRNMEIYNGAIQLSNNQQDIPFYKKSKLVPGPEILPFRAALMWLKPLFDKMGGTTEGLGTQVERSVFWNKKGQSVAPVICYESIYGDYCGDYVRHGANALFIMTNDGWWDNTPGYQQHLAFAQLRAIELRRSIARSANTGTSCVINALGEVSQATAYGETTAIKATISLDNRLTFYAKHGDYLAKLGVFIAASLLILLFLKNAKSVKGKFFSKS